MARSGNPGERLAAALQQTQAPAPRTEDTFRVKDGGNSAEVEKTSTQKVRTLADLIRVCEIDTSTWDIASWECKASQMMNVPRAVGFEKNWRRPSTTPVITQLYHVSAKLKRKTPLILAMQQLRTDLVADIRKEARKFRPVAKVKTHTSGWLFEYPPFDLHMGKLAWDEETVVNYDCEIATDLVDASLEFHLQRALKLTDNRIERILCVFGNDVSHIDNRKGETTMGTKMDFDTRYVRIYRRICAVKRRTIETLAKIAPVDIVMVSGNHDELTAFHLGELLAAQYDGRKHIHVDNSARLRKYYEFGVNLFGFTHGDSERVTELPLLMAREQQEAWARCPSREWHIGHLHIAEKWEHRARLTQDLHSDKGVRIRRLPSLSGHDFWHTRHGYCDRRASESFIFHKTAGFTDHLSFNVDHLTGKCLYHDLDPVGRTAVAAKR